MDQPVLADVEVSRAGAALPVVRLPVGEVQLEPANAGVQVLEHLAASVNPLHHLVKHRALFRSEGLEQAGSVVDDANRGRETELRRPLIDRPRVIGVLDAAADHRVDVDVEVGVFGQPLELLVEEAEALLRDLVRLDVVDADLEVVQPGLVQRLDALGGHQVAVGDQARDHAAAPNPSDQGIEIGMQHRLAAAEGDDRSAKGGELVDPREHLRRRDRLRHLVVFVAIAAIDVAATDGDDVHQQRMIRTGEAAQEFAHGTGASAEGRKTWHVATQYIRRLGWARRSGENRGGPSPPVQP